MLEAGAMRLPVVSTRTMGATEIIENNLSGLLVPRENPEAIAKAILHLIDNPERGRSFSENLRDRVLSKFRWENAWKMYRQLVTNGNLV